MEDKIIKCENCGQSFVWTMDEQKFFEREKIEEPEYCVICRGLMKAAGKDNFRGKIGNRKN